MELEIQLAADHDGAPFESSRPLLRLDNNNFEAHHSDLHRLRELPVSRLIDPTLSPCPEAPSKAKHDWAAYASGVIKRRIHLRGLA